MHWRIEGGAKDAAPPGGPNSFIFMQFSAKFENNSNFGSWRTPLGKILDPPLIWAKQSSGVAYSVVNSAAKDVSSVTQFTAPPGVLTSVEIHKENYKRLSEPYGQCSSSECSRDDCILQCYKTKLVENCNCIVLEEYDPKGNENLTFCLSVHHSPSQLVENLRYVESVNNGILDACFAFCKPKCQEVRYKTQASYTKWPLPHQFTSFYNKLIKHQPFSEKFDILDCNNNSNTEDAFMLQFKSLLKKQLVEDNFLKLILL